MFKGYLDSYNKITAYLSLHHYDGKSYLFYLQDEDNNLIVLTIDYLVKEKDYIKYVLTTPKLEIGKKYLLLDEHLLFTPLIYRFVTKDPLFEEQFKTDAHLGVEVKDNFTTFSIWAPTASKVILHLIEKSLYLPLKRMDKGLYQITIEEDLHLVKYQYLIEVNGTINLTTDPYAMASESNNLASVVINLDKIKRSKTDFIKTKSILDAIIYELNVFDFTSHPDTDIKDKGKFKGLYESGKVSKNQNKVGIDYLSSLNITHIQLQPILSFATTDDTNPTLFYNWGYDPVSFFSLKNGYGTSLNPLSPIEEFIELVDSFHQRGIGVIVDVVYNHLFNHQLSALEKTVPYYYFRYKDGLISSGSFCHNDFESRSWMGKHLLISSIKHLLNLYKVDGFRFDLLGIIDISTANEIALEAKKINPYVYLYGEGWNMPTYLDDGEKSTMYNSGNLLDYSFFNDRFRETLRGGFSTLSKKGYVGGNKEEIASFYNVFLGSCTSIGIDPLFNTPAASINYVECHDNHTFYDRLKLSCFDNEWEIKRRCRLSLALVGLAQGVPFYHFGQEYYRTKGGKDNTYLDSNINQFDVNKLEECKEDIDFFKQLNQFRKESDFLKLDKESIATKVKIKNELDLEFIIFELEQQTITIIINVSGSPKTVELEQKSHLIFDLNGKTSQIIKTLEVDKIDLKIVKMSK